MPTELDKTLKLQRAGWTNGKDGWYPPGTFYASKRPEPMDFDKAWRSFSVWANPAVDR